MFTESFYKKFGSTIKTANIFSFPLIWNENEKRLHFSPSLHTNAIFAHLYLWIFTLSHFVHIVKYKLLKDAVNSTLFLTAFLSSCAAGVTVSILTFKSRETARFWNSLFSFMQKFAGKLKKLCKNYFASFTNTIVYRKLLVRQQVESCRQF